MYNEVSHICPHCARENIRSYGQGQISQVVDGFGGHCLTDLQQLKHRLEDDDFTPDQLKRVASCATNAWFTCDGNANHTFKADPAMLLAITMLADRFVVDTTNDTLSRAAEMLKELYPD
jgi:hypothetical protein